MTVNGIGRFCRLIVCRLIVGPGNESDYRKAADLVDGYRPLIAMADKGYDADWFIDALRNCGIGEIAIPSKRNRKVSREYNQDIYKGRNVVERAIAKLKHYRRIATRYEKMARNYYSLICLAAAVINAK